jgi:predicted DNA-binding protein (MmcQ/YjbR family)
MVSINQSNRRESSHPFVGHHDAKYQRADSEVVSQFRLIAYKLFALLQVVVKNFAVSVKCTQAVFGVLSHGARPASN